MYITGGGYDTKITSYTLFTNSNHPMQCMVVNGPTSQDQIPFQWSTSVLSIDNSHLGQPDIFDFEFELVQL